VSNERTGGVRRHPIPATLRKLGVKAHATKPAREERT